MENAPLGSWMQFRMDFISGLFSSNLRLYLNSLYNYFNRGTPFIRISMGHAIRDFSGLSDKMLRTHVLSIQRLRKTFLRQQNVDLIVL